MVKSVPFRMAATFLNKNIISKKYFRVNAALSYAPIFEKQNKVIAIFIQIFIRKNNLQLKYRIRSSDFGFSFV
jgi:hypothetical protein